MRRIIVTGGAGFIGSNFVHHMLAKYPSLEILNYDKLTYAGNLDNLKGIESRHELVTADICNYDTFSQCIKSFKPDAIVAFAAESHVDRSIEDPQAFLETNILGTETILRCVKEQKVPRLIHISTDEVYGSLVDGEAAEKDPFKPNSPYSASKASGDMMCRAYHVTYGTPVVVLRGSNCYGPRQHPEKFIPRSLTNIMSGEPMLIYGEGLNIREWIYTEDFCRGVETALFMGKLGEVYNLGGGQHNRVQNIQIASLLCNSLNGEMKHIEDRLGHDFRYALNSDKLMQLGWKPQYDFSEGLVKTIEWYKENTWWWKPLR